MDLLDTQILSALQANSRLSASAIAGQVNLSVPAVLERMKKLRAAGVIERYTVRINRKAVGLKLLAFVFVRLDGSGSIGGFRDQIIGFASVLECHHIAGAYDYVLKIAVEDTDELEKFLSAQLKRIGGVAETNTQIVLATLKEEFNA
mgnify:CR=1 FL=1